MFRRQRMKKVTLLCGILLAITAGVAVAAGLDLHWNNCAAGAGATANMNFACGDDRATFQATGQFQMPSALTGVTLIGVMLDLASATPALPPRWQLNPGE